MIANSIPICSTNNSNFIEFLHIFVYADNLDCLHGQICVKTHCVCAHLLGASREDQVVVDGARLDGVYQVDHHLAISQHLVLKYTTAGQ